MTPVPMEGYVDMGVLGFYGGTSRSLRNHEKSILVEKRAFESFG